MGKNGLEYSEKEGFQNVSLKNKCDNQLHKTKLNWVQDKGFLSFEQKKK
jgi:hypothetical protein